MSSTQYSKAKGRAWENEIVNYLISQGVLAERRRLSGVQDRGDIAGIPFVMIEGKHERTYKLPQYMREVLQETLNAKARIGVAWLRQNGKPGAENGFIVMTPDTFLTLLREAGFLPKNM